jgi:prepilin-type N-terminal cleavage/methylation domain-containing protein
MPKKIAKGFTLIELLVVLAIISILSGAGVVVYNDYASTAKDSVTKINHTKIVNSMESEFVKCKLDKNSKIFNSHNCNSSNRPSTGTINNYVNNSLGLKNPYDNKQAVAQSNVCTSGSISITEKETGSYNVAYASIKNKKKYTSLVSSGWSNNYSNTKTTSVAYTCASASTSSSQAKNTIYNYKPPNDGPGAGIIVDENGNMIKGGGSGTSGAHACGANCFQTNSPGMKNWWTKDAQGNRIYPNRAGSKYRFVMTEGPSKSGNIASSCAQGNCKYNFSNNTYTVLSSGITYKAGESIDTRKPINP